MFEGLFSLPWWGYLLAGFVLTHITIVSVTVFLHRSQSHRSVELHPLLSHFFRLWLWLTTGMVTRQWVAIHRKHHAFCDRDGDPHSPQLEGIRKVLWEGAELYRQSTGDRELLEQYGRGTPDDWLERRLYSRYPYLGLAVMLLLDVLCFGAFGLTLWAIQLLWIPFWAAGVINGLGHWWGYRNFEVSDASTNLFPLALLVGGEELHNNHHAYPSSAKLSCRWFEVDLGWTYIRLFEVLRLARAKRDSLIKRLPSSLCARTLANRLQVLQIYGREVLLPILKEEARTISDRTSRRLLKKSRWLMLREKSDLSETQLDRVKHSLAQSDALATVYEFQNRLRDLWLLPGRSSDKLAHALHEWCVDARESGVAALAEFAERVAHAQRAAAAA